MHVQGRPEEALSPYLCPTLRLCKRAECWSQAPVHTHGPLRKSLDGKSNPHEEIKSASKGNYIDKYNSKTVILLTFFPPKRQVYKAIIINLLMSIHCIRCNLCNSIMEGEGKEIDKNLVFLYSWYQVGINLNQMLYVLISRGFHIILPQTEWLKTKWIYALTVLQSQNLKSRCPQGWILSEGSREECFRGSL